MIGKLLNFGKKDQFFLELKDGETTKASAPAKAVATAVQPKAEPVAKEEVAPKTGPTTETPVPAATTTTEVPVKSAKKISKKSKKGQESVATAPAPKPVAIDTSYSEEPFWVKLMYKTNEQKAAEKIAEKTFATDYLIAKPKSRRRPGGSVDKFKTMARQTKVRF